MFYYFPSKELTGTNPLASFIRITSVNLKDANQSQYNAEAFSAKFSCVVSSYFSSPTKGSNSLSGMTGTFNSTIQSEISGSAPSVAGPTAAATTSGSGFTTTSAAAASTVKPNSAASSAAGSSSNSAGPMVVPRVLSATGVAAIVFAFCL